MPSARLASKFSAQNDYCHGIRDVKKRGLPFGCHYCWSVNYNFWKPYIESYGYKLPEMEAYSTLITDECYRLIYFIKRRIRSEQGLKEVMDKMPGNGIYCVYGGGKFGKECIDFLQMLPVTIKNIYDKNSNKKEVCGISIVRPDKETLEKKDSHIIISSIKYESEMKKVLYSANLKEGEDFSTIYKLCKNILKSIS